MKVIFPISAHDIHLAEAMGKIVAAFGPYDHHVVIVPTKEIVSDVRYQSFVETISGSFLGCEQFIPRSGFGEGWPNACNAHFAFTVNRLTENGNKDPFFWCEMDCVPKTQSWLEDLDNAYKSYKKPFLGRIVDTPFRTPEGQITSKTGDQMMMGCAIYPPFIHALKDYSALFSSLGSGACMTPWDVFIRWFMKNAGWASTNLIGDRWNTIEYAEGFECKPNKTEFAFRDHSKTDVSDAALIHGCKDGSLARLIIQGLPETVRCTNPPESGADNATCPNSSVIAAAGTDGAKHIGSTQIIAAGGDTSKPAISFPDKRFILKKINEKSTRLKDLMAYFDIEPAAIHDFTKYLQDNGMDAKRPAYWVKEK